MSLWLTRAGRNGEYEQKFLEEKKVYLTWGNLNHDLTKPRDKSELQSVLSEHYPEAKSGKIINHSGQIWAFAKRMEVGDWIVLPSKQKASIHIGRITGEYKYNAAAGSPYYHSRSVEWIETDIPRTNFDQDLLHSFGAFMTICQIKRNEAESRVKKMEKNSWKSVSPKFMVEEEATDDSAESSGFYDIERLARDQLTKLLAQKFQGHELSTIIEEILKAKGYETFKSPPGPDKGVDILAAPGSMGFGDPKICVQVKSGDTPVDRPTMDQLIGTMRNFRAEHGLLVSWAGFKTSVMKEQANQFFQVRLWDSDKIVEELLSVYDKLDDDLKAEIPMKSVWTLSISED